ncbi:uncharacterized protein IL334_005512 [Kwoniella shivajii]|uniref:Uncharacterized protein n=1 Tax=Kwoniella shivajii TaxID=564305 RepID=A0ABZ1D3S2_9TREE|nr:hypothetical protein IL334_005512 [Kwoniella shivajii]
MPGESRIDRDTIPTEYLQSYPYPAFVLVVPTSSSQSSENGQHTSHIHSYPRDEQDIFEPFKIFWANDKWRNLARGNTLLECLDVEGARKLGNWISGLEGNGKSDLPSPDKAQSEAGPSQYAQNTLAASRNNTASPQGGPKSTGYDRIGQSPHSPRSIQHASFGQDDPAQYPSPSFTLPFRLDLVHPVRTAWKLLQVIMPIWRIGENAERTQIGTHNFAIITTIPRTSATLEMMNGLRAYQGDKQDVKEIVSPQIEEKPFAQPKTTVLTGSPGSHSNTLNRPIPSAFSSDPSVTRGSGIPTEELKGFDFSTKQTEAIRFGRDGTVTRPTPKAKSSSSDTKYKTAQELMDSTDWAATSLGPRDQWPQSLKTAASLVLHYPHQCCLWWGKDLTLIYNDAYAQMIHKHPHIFGTSGIVAWSEVWHSLGPLSELVLNGTPVYKEDDFLLFKQLPADGDATMEEYHTWMWVPVEQEDGTFGGLWNATIATTSKVLAERRMTTVQEMGQRTSNAKTMQEFDEAVTDILAANPRDVPFAALYHVDMPSTATRSSEGTQSIEVTRSDGQSGSQAVHLRLAGSIGIPDEHPTTPSAITMDIRQRMRGSAASSRSRPRSPSLSVMSGHSHSDTQTSHAGTSVHSEEDESSFYLKQWPIREALASNRLVMVENCQSMIDGFPLRVWDELPTSAVVVPIANDSDEGIPSAVLIIGLNVRRFYDDDYEAFIRSLQDHSHGTCILTNKSRLRVQLASGIAAVRSYEAERRRIEELAALDRAKSTLFSNVSHELRTPLTLIAGPLDDLLHETPAGSRRETLVMARRNVRRLTRLVSTLMDVSRLEAGRLKGSFQLVNLGTMTRDLAVLFRSAMEKARLQYFIECDLSLRPVYVDTEHWEKVVYNLIGNAMKYTMAGSISVKLKYESGDAIFAVQDTGVGIPASDIDLVGERFHRVQSVSRSHEGTGIGLALIKELIKLHGGTMSIDSTTADESKDGSHGSTFSVRIPLGSGHLPPGSVDEVAATQATQTTYGQSIIDEAMQWTRDREHSSTTSLDGSDRSSSPDDPLGRNSKGIDTSTLYFKKEDVIMLVDDSYDTRRYMFSIFAPFCTVIEARDGQEALALCAQQAPDLIISDVMMPNLDGFGLLRALKQSKKLAIIPIIMLTARGGDEARVDGILAGADVARAHMQLQFGKRRKSLEEAFDQRTSELRAVTEYSPVGLFRTANDGEVTLTNSALHELSGYPVDQAVEDWGVYIAEDEKPGMVAFWERVLGGEDDEISISHDTKFSNGRWVQIKAIRLNRLGGDAGSGLTGILGCVIDITERKLNEEAQRLRVTEAEQRRQEAEEAKRQQELLIDITSHEIRNPISSLMQISLDYCSSLVKTNLLTLQEQLELVHRNKSSFVPTEQLLTNIEEDLEALESIYQCGLAQERISNDVLSLGKIQLEMFDVEVDMLRETQKVLSIFQNEARMKRIELCIKYGEGIDILGIKSVKTDPVRLSQIVTNLLSNAIRFTATSYDTCLMPRTPILPKDLADDMPIYLYFAVTDTGPGMTEAELGLLFQRFSQVSLKTHTIFGGSGLGLFVCRQITQIMGGKIDVTSQKGKGTTFRFFIKALTSQTANVRSSVEVKGSIGKLTNPSKSKAKDAFQFAGKKPHVLIVEDNLINQTVLARQLRHCNVTCDVANNGLEALEKIRTVCSINTIEAPFDCILMDLEMPVMDGLTALKHIREEEAEGKLNKNLVIALTGNARQGQIDEAMSRGMDDVVIKPYRLDDLLQKIEAMMRLRGGENQIDFILSCPNFIRADHAPGKPQIIDYDRLDDGYSPLWDIGVVWSNDKWQDLVEVDVPLAAILGEQETERLKRWLVESSHSKGSPAVKHINGQGGKNGPSPSRSLRNTNLTVHLSYPINISLSLTKTLISNSSPEIAISGPASGSLFVITCTPQPEMAMDVTAKSHASQARQIYLGNMTEPSIPFPILFSHRISGTDPSTPRSNDVSVLLQTIDWDQTPLGPREHWPKSLKTIVSVVFGYLTPAAIFWGEECTLIYNEAYSRTTAKHPYAFGEPGAEVYKEVWDFLGPMAAQAMKGVSFNQEDATARSMEEYDSAIVESMQISPRDVPFMALYRMDPKKGTTYKKTEHESGAIEEDGFHTMRLTASIGVPRDHPSMPFVANVMKRKLPATASFQNPSDTPPNVDFAILPPVTKTETLSDSNIVWPIGEVLESHKMVVMQDCRNLMQGFPIRVWDDLPEAAVIIPLNSDSEQDVPDAILILGLNKNRPLDEGYMSFLIGSGIAAVRAAEDQTLRVENLAALDRAKTVLFSNISHELRTPLTLIKGPVEDLLQSSLDRSQRDLLTMAQRNVRRLTRLVSSLMDISKLAANKLTGTFRLVNLGALTNDLASMFCNVFEKTNLQYKIDCNSEPSETYIDSEHWEKIVLNLISNAMKYTLQGSVDVVLRYELNTVVLEVRDTGAGIPSNDLDRIGERFHRVASTSRSHEGTGIGLALVKDLVRLHGGTFEIESVTATESGDGSHGSTFRTRIPLGFNHLPNQSVILGDVEHIEARSYADDLVSEANLWNRNQEGPDKTSYMTSGGTSTGSTSSGSSPSVGLDFPTKLFDRADTIMIVDDSYDMRKVIEAHDGQEALELCSRALPDLIISDIMMPRLDGFGLLQALKSSSNLISVPIILLTARGDQDFKVGGLMSGAEDYLSKPFSTPELLARSHLQLLLGKKRRQLETAYQKQTQELRAVLDYKWAQSVAESSLEHLTAFWTSAFTADPSKVTESCDFQWANGRWVTVQVTQLSLVEPGLTGLLGCVTDITDRRKHEEAQKLRITEAENRRVEAEEAKRQQELLIDITSHEIRNPISTIQEQLEVCMNKELPFKPTGQLMNTIKEDLDALESIYQCGLSQERICSDVLSLGRIQLDMLQMYDTETNIREEAQKVLSIFQSEARMKRISLSLKEGESMERLGIDTIKIDHVRLGQVFTNLLSNAIRFTANSDIRRIELAVDLSFDPPSDSSCGMPPPSEQPQTVKPGHPIYLYVAITDTGPGLTPEELQKLFHRFSQVSPKTHTVFGGSGLGLFVCRKITDIMGGRIEVLSERGKGSTFRFFVEARTCEMTTSTTPSQISSPSGSIKSKRPKAPKLKQTESSMSVAMSKIPSWAVGGKKPKVLIVEDNLINQTVLARQLKHVGFTVQVANNGLEALEKFRQISSSDGSKEKSSFNCVIMDLEMPVMDGLTAVKQIRQDEITSSLSRTPVLALTGNARQGQIDEAKLSGMDDVIIKPYRLDDLLSKIESMIRPESNDVVAETNRLNING